MKKFGLLSYSQTANLGDEIQSLAARQFLPHVDRLIDREQLHAVQSEPERHYWTVLNGWFCHFPENWPPSPCIRPLLVSFHVSPDPGGAGSVGLPAETILLSQPFRKYLQGFGPVGARDLATLRRLQEAGIDSYFSGCLTLTLQRPDVQREDDLIVLNDVPEHVEQAIQQWSRKRTFNTYHWDESPDSAQRFRAAEELLHTYARASCVVTTRLHCALPCTAMGTPVLLLDTADDQHRFAGLHDFVRHCTVDGFLERRSGFDVNRPTPNPDRHLACATDLRRRVSQFVNAPEYPVAAYPLSPAEMQEGLRLINTETAVRLFGEKGRRSELEEQLERIGRVSVAA